LEDMDPLPTMIGAGPPATAVAVAALVREPTMKLAFPFIGVGVVGAYTAAYFFNLRDSSSSQNYYKYIGGATVGLATGLLSKLIFKV
jgi:hypothetical protein